MSKNIHGQNIINFSIDNSALIETYVTENDVSTLVLIPIVELDSSLLNIDASWNNYFIKLISNSDVSIYLDSTIQGTNLTFENEDASSSIFFISGTGAPVIKSVDLAISIVSQYGMGTCIYDGSSWYISGDIE